MRQWEGRAAAHIYASRTWQKAIWQFDFGLEAAGRIAVNANGRYRPFSGGSALNSAARANESAIIDVRR